MFVTWSLTIRTFQNTNSELQGRESEQICFELEYQRDTSWTNKENDIFGIRFFSKENTNSRNVYSIIFWSLFPHSLTPPKSIVTNPSDPESLRWEIMDGGSKLWSHYKPWITRTSVTIMVDNKCTRLDRIFHGMVHATTFGCHFQHRGVKFYFKSSTVAPTLLGLTNQFIWTDSPSRC